MHTQHQVLRSNDSQFCTIAFQFGSCEADVGMVHMPSGRWIVASCAFFQITQHGLPMRIEQPGWMVEATRRDAVQMAQQW